MHTFDNSSSLGGGRESIHLRFTINNQKYLYTYIRKNACSSFKNLLQSEYLLKEKAKEITPSAFKISFWPLCFPTVFRLLSRKLSMHDIVSLYGIENVGVAQTIPNRIFIYRDPIERIISVFNNKLIQQNGASDISRHIESNVKGLKSLEEINFDSFVEDYLVRVSEGLPVDPHLMPQKSHLLPIVYNCAIPIKFLYNDLKILFGQDIANKFFLIPHNATAGFAASSTEFTGNVPIKRLRQQFIVNRKLPTAEMLMSESTAKLIQGIYRQDYNMIKKLNK